jgi:hypothetical protein
MQTNEETSDAVKRRSTGTIEVTRRRGCRNGRVDERMGSVVVRVWPLALLLLKLL